ncbi:MAG: N-acetylmuramoyl-L-alanine amidase family protein [Verrucomicrobiales bacterium]|nr:N-acetylmuramoyl-L-alanine amidase [Verrucomicrobiota bacterium JB025]
MPLLKPLTIILLCVIGSLAQAASFRTVVIDPGHGGQDKGGNWGKVYEKHLALDTAIRLENRLKRMGYNTVMTRRSDTFVSLHQRTAIANRQKDAIFVSVHYNYTWKRDVSGLETFYFNSEGAKLARHVQSQMVRKTGGNNRNAKYARYYVIRNCRLPGILVECGFVSNSSERDRMKSGDFRESIADSIAEGIQSYRRSR